MGSASALPNRLRDRRRLQQRVVDGFFGGFERRLEQRRHAVGRQQRARLRRRSIRSACADRRPSRTRSQNRRCRCCRTSRCAPARTRRAPRAASDRAHRAAHRSRRRSCTSRRRDRPVGCRPAGLLALAGLIRIASKHLPDRRAAHRQHAAVVRSAPARRRCSRRSARRACATRCRCRPSSRTPACRCRRRRCPPRPAPLVAAVERLEHVLRPHVLAANVVQAAVVGLADQRVHRSHVVVAGLIERPAHEAFDRGADAQACW